MRDYRRTLFRSMSEKRAAVKCESWARLARPTWRHRLSCSCASRSSAPCRLHSRYPPLSRPRHSSSPIYKRGASVLRLLKFFVQLADRINVTLLSWPQVATFRLTPPAAGSRYLNKSDILICPVILLLGGVADPRWIPYPGSLMDPGIPYPDFYPIPDPTTAKKRRYNKKFAGLPLLWSHKYHKIENYFIFEKVKKKI